MSPPHRPLDRTASSATRALVIASLANVTPAMTVSTMGIALPEIRATLVLSEVEAGTLFSATFVAASVASAAAGRVLDQTGKKPVLILAMSCLCLAFMLAGLSRLYGLTLGLLALAGVGYGFITPAAIALMADLLPGRRGLGVGLVSLSYALGGLTGPIIASYVTAVAGWRASFLAIGLAGLILTALEQLGVHVPPRSRRSPEPIPLRKTLNRNLILLALAQLCAGSMWWSTTSWAPTVLRAEKALSVTQTGIVMGLWGAAPILGAPLLGMLSDKVGRKAMIVWTGYPSALAAFVLFYWLKSPGALTLGASILGLLITAFPTLVIALAQDSTRPEAADTASGIIMATHYVAAVLAPLATAQLLATTGNMVWTMVAATAGPLVLYASLVAAVGEKPMRVPGPSPTV